MADKDKNHPLPCEGGRWLRDPETGALTRAPETSEAAGEEAAGDAPPINDKSRKGKEK